MAWKNFSIWRGKLPHWRADGVTYFVTFRHRRPLLETESMTLFRAILKLDGRRWNVLALTVLPERTEMLVEVREGTDGNPYELSDLVEKAKGGAAKRITKETEERWPPFYNESYDHIVRDEAERTEFFDAIIDGSVKERLVEIAEEWPTLYVAEGA